LPGGVEDEGAFLAAIRGEVGGLSEGLRVSPAGVTPSALAVRGERGVVVVGVGAGPESEEGANIAIRAATLGLCLAASIPNGIQPLESCSITHFQAKEFTHRK
jgi:hypothetical protein